MTGLLVFLAGFRHLIRQARQDYEWVGTLVFGVGLVVIAIELVADGLEAGSALDTWVKADPMAVRALMEGSFPMFGAIGLILSALLLGLGGLRQYGYRSASRMDKLVRLRSCSFLIWRPAPSILGGTNITGFYTASGYAPFVGQAAMLVWFLFASISMIVKRQPSFPE